MRYVFVVLVLLAGCAEKLDSRIIEQVPIVENQSAAAPAPEPDTGFEEWIESRRTRARVIDNDDDKEDEPDTEERADSFRMRFAYQLQHANFNGLNALDVDLIVVDPDDADFSESQLQELNERKQVFAYLSVGEAETYRDYWQESWGEGNPSWLGPENTQWGSYRVKYWERGWQDIVFQRLDEMERQGYSGVFLDTVDTYRHWRENGVPDAEEKMAALVKELAGRTSMQVYANNALDLHEDAEYLDAIDGNGIEGLWYVDGRSRDAHVTEGWERDLDRAKSAGKRVLVLEYVSGSDACDVLGKAEEKGYWAYVATRELDHIVHTSC